MLHQIFSLSCNEFNEPGDPSDLFTVVDAVIGPHVDRNPSKAGSIFRFKVCTAQFVVSEISRSGFFVCENAIILKKFSWEDVAKAIESIMSTIESLINDNPQVVFELALGEFAVWEFAGVAEAMSLGDDRTDNQRYPETEPEDPER